MNRGDGATYHILGDSYPFTVIHVTDDEAFVVVQPDNHRRVSGSEETNDAVYEYTAQPTYTPRLLKRMPDKSYREYGTGHMRGAGWTFGERRYRRDPHV